MNEQDLKDRTKQLALRVIKLVDALPKTTAGRIIGNQLIRSGTAVGANYRAACRGRSNIFTASGRTAKANNQQSEIRDPKC